MFWKGLCIYGMGLWASRSMAKCREGGEIMYNYTTQKGPLLFNSNEHTTQSDSSLDRLASGVPPSGVVPRLSNPLSVINLPGPPPSIVLAGKAGSPDS